MKKAFLVTTKPNDNNARKNAILCRIKKGFWKFSMAYMDIFRYGKDVQYGYYAVRSLINLNTNADLSEYFGSKSSRLETYFIVGSLQAKKCHGGVH